MTKKIDIKPANTKGANIFKKIWEDKAAIKAHLDKGEKIADLKDNFRFVKPVSTTGK